MKTQHTPQRCTVCNEKLANHDDETPCENNPHTPTPWKVKKAVSLGPSNFWTIETVNGKNTPVSAILKEQDAELIVRAVNAHEALVDALNMATATIERLANTPAKVASVQGTYDVCRAALAKAEGAS